MAFDSELQREVALKQIKPERADDADSRARFLLEAEVTGRLEHPGIVPVYGLGIDDHGRPFYAMRFVRGTSLEEAIRQYHRADGDSRRDARARALELRQLLDRFADVCHTVAYAHSRGVLHRDLKPANILLGPFNESLVVDWGLAKVFVRSPAAERAAPRPGLPTAPAADHPGQDSDVSGLADRRATAQEQGAVSAGDAPLGVSSSTDTAAGTAFGTPAFMSPEQAEGRLDQLGPASDVYSLGAVLYTLLCGRAPFEYVWCDVTALIDRVRLGEFPPPRKVNARVPRALEAVCLQSDGPAPGRPLRLGRQTWPWRSSGGWPTSRLLAYREPAPARLARWGRRHKPVVAGAAALLVTAVAALSAGIVLLGREQRKTEHQRLRGRAAARAGHRESRITPPPRRGQPGQPGVPRIPRRQRRPGRRALERLPGGPLRVGMGVRPPAGALGAQDLRGLEPGSRRLVGGVFTRLRASGLRLRPLGYRGRGPDRRAGRSLGPDR